MSRIVYEGEERWDFINLVGEQRVYGTGGDGGEEGCYYQWGVYGDAVPDPDVCPTCTVTFDTWISGDPSAENPAGCPEYADAWPHTHFYAGVAATKDGEEASCLSSTHEGDVQAVMDDAADYAESGRFVFIGSPVENSTWDELCFTLGRLQLGIDRLTGDLQGAFEVEYSNDYWSYVEVSGAFSADQAGD